MGLELGFRELGEVPYEPTWHAMQRFVAERDKSVMDEAWLLQHPAVFTQGQAGKAEHVLFPGDIPVIQVDRGGQVTTTAPASWSPTSGVLWSAGCIGLLASYDVQPDAPGVYVDGAKIASLGLRIRNGCSFHGLALNLDMDLRPFQRINPCGYAGMPMTQLRDLVGPVDFAECTRLRAGSSHALATLNRRPLRAGSN